eukprot:5144133-Pyramimonas_sp.AAC.1
MVTHEQPFPIIFFKLCCLVVDLGIEAFLKESSTEWYAVPGKTFTTSYFMCCLVCVLIAEGGNARGCVRKVVSTAKGLHGLLPPLVSQPGHM